MPTLHKPAVYFPEYIINQQDTINLARTNFKDNPNLEKSIELIINTSVMKRRIIQPIELATLHPGFGYRNAVFEYESKRLVTGVVEEALHNASVSASQIAAIIYVSYSGFLMPSRFVE